MPKQALPQAHRRLAKAAGPGWSFLGAWPADDRALIEATLQRRVLKGMQPADDRWTFTFGRPRPRFTGGGGAGTRSTSLTSMTSSETWPIIMMPPYRVWSGNHYDAAVAA